MKKNNLIPFFFLLFSFTIYSQNEEIGKSFIQSVFVEKNYEKAYDFLNDDTKKTISLAVLKETTPKIEAQIGQFKSILEVNKDKNLIIYYSAFDKMNLDVKITFDDTSKIASFYVAPHKAIVKEENGLGSEFKIKSNTIELKGTLLLTKENNQKKIVIFVHGSGPNDRNESVGENKPFKDIAEGLYNLGISSYRYDKRTYSNPESFSDKSTIDDEVTNDVLNVVDFIKKDKQFEGFEIIVLGHSLGAHVMPRIANKSTNINKIIMLAGNNRPLDVSILEQYDYLYSLKPSEELKQEAENVKKQAANLHAKDFNATTPNEKLPLGLSAIYWKSLLDYRPLNEIKKVKIPILILQGERDYQVTMVDFNNWKKTLKNNKKAHFISYPKLNHLFLAGEGAPNPTEYEVKGHVEPKVIIDIANFIK
jgi:uncharacterized protein